MPTVARWFIKTGLICLILALLIGILMTAGTSASFFPAVGRLFPIYLHLLVMGWITQLIFGVVYWMFPKYSKEKPRGSPTLGWITYAALNIGLLLRAVAEPMIATPPAWLWGWLLVLSALLQWIAGMAFVVNTWGRVKEK